VNLVELVCAEAGAILPSRLAWRRRTGLLSTGSTRPAEGLISVRAGEDLIDQRLTLLHELAHWLRPPHHGRHRRAIHHTVAFYATAFALYARHGIQTDDILRLEATRYPSSLRHAVVLGLPGAAAALRERHARLRARPRARWRVMVPEHSIRLERDGRWTVCAVCRQRIVGVQLARLRRRRTPASHVLWTRA
jgi:hypothetical protein